MIRKVSLFETYRKACMNNPNGSQKDQFEAFLEIVQSDPAYVVALARDYFDRRAQSWGPQEHDGSTTLAATHLRDDREKARAARRGDNERIVKSRLAAIKAKARIVLTLDSIMPNGKRLRECTFAEVRKFGGIFAELARHGKGNEVITKHINAKDLENIVSRFEKPAQRRRSAPSAGYEARV